MCGVWGTIAINKNVDNGLNNDDLLLMKNMMVAGAVRGIDGTGFASVHNDGSCETLKVGGNPYHILFDKKFPEYRDRLLRKGRAYFGHNRYATVGEVNNDNAHPFIEDHITLIHNGTLRSGLKVPKDEVDSRMLAREIAKNGPEIFKEIDGAWVCVWHNTNKNTINIIKNGERPLAMGQSFSRLFFASEMGMLSWLLNNAKIMGVNEYKLENDTLLTIDMESREMIQTPFASNRKTYYGGYGYYGGYYEGGNEPKKDTGITPPVMQEVGDSKIQTTTDKSDDKTMGRKKNDDQEIIFRISSIKPTKNNYGKEYFGVSNRQEHVRFFSKATYNLHDTLRGPIESYTYLTGEDGKKYISYRPAVKKLVVIAHGLPHIPTIDDARPDDNETIRLRSGENFTRRSLRLFLESRNWECSACADQIQEEVLPNCGAILSRKNRGLSGIYCPACTDVALRKNVVIVNPNGSIQ